VDSGLTDALAQQITQYDMQVLAVCTVFAAFAGLFRSLDDHDYRGGVHLVSLANISGLLGLSAATAIAWWRVGVVGNEYPMVFTSIAIGLGGKTIEKLTRRITEKAVESFAKKVFGVSLDEEDNDLHDDAVDD
jgi:hypothetical protein